MEQSIATRSGILLWASHLWAICSSSSTSRWIASLSNILKYVSEQPAAARVEIGPSKLLGTLAKARRADRMPKPFKEKALQVVSSIAFDCVISVIEEAGERSGWHRDLQAQSAQPQNISRQNFFASINWPDDNKVTTVLRTFRRWHDCAFTQTFLASVSIGGATAAAQVYATLRMPESMLLLNLELLDKICKG